MSDLGSDFDCPGDLKPDARLLTSPTEQITAWLQALARRLQTPRGALFYDTDYGLDLRSYLSDDEEPAVAAHEINQELLKDERTSRCTTDIAVAADSWTITSTPTFVDGATYALTFLVTAGSIDLLTAGPSS